MLEPLVPLDHFRGEVLFVVILVDALRVFAFFFQSPHQRIVVHNDIGMLGVIDVGAVCALNQT